MRENFKSGAAQHRFNSGAIGDPPIRGITRVSLFNEIHFGEIRTLEHVLFPKFIIVLNRLNCFAAALE